MKVFVLTLGVEIIAIYRSSPENMIKAERLANKLQLGSESPIEIEEFDVFE